MNDTVNHRRFKFRNLVSMRALTEHDITKSRTLTSLYRPKFRNEHFLQIIHLNNMIQYQAMIRGRRLRAELTIKLSEIYQ